GKIGMPCVLKTRTLGYDGHGQAIIRSVEDMEKAADLLTVPCILEEMVDFDFECSVIMVSDGKDIIHFPVSRNIHREGILDLCIVPASGLQNGGGENDLCRRITASCESFMKSCAYRGILAIELFVKGDRFYFNEMAPRPHNSGHWTIEGCTTSQYMELCHFLLDMPLERPELLSPAVMKNILGQDLDAAKAVVAESLAGAGPGIEVSASEDVDNAFCGEAGKGVHVHLYGKTQSRPKRKMGHITFVPMTPERYYSGWAARFV
ncbi:MAG: ATP-grasp domain-containing protein, partial [Bacteroidetes bacterium]|nr:ATP-grasp domain-containing protein [Candidatus Cryptobacteroides gallistercoris]